MTDQTTTSGESDPSNRARANGARGLRRRLVGALAAAAVAVGALGAAGGAQAACTAGLDSGVLAKSARTLQSDMMVAALSCNERPLYNAFATDYRGDLQRHGKALKAHFDHNKTLNAYVTELANDAAIRYARTGGAFCTAARETMYELLADGAEVDFDLYVLRYAIAVRPALAVEVATAAGDGGACDELVAVADTAE